MTEGDYFLLILSLITFSVEFRWSIFMGYTMYNNFPFQNTLVSSIRYHLIPSIGAYIATELCMLLIHSIRIYIRS